MEAVIFCGVQASGKSTFYAQRFFDSHLRISRDLLRTPHREAIFLTACLDTRMPFVVDKMNVTRADRRPYVERAQAAGFRVTGYWFDAGPHEAVERNAARAGSARVPVRAILGTHKRLQPPSYAEGFETLQRVTIAARDGGFVVEPLAAESADP